MPLESQTTPEPLPSIGVDAVDMTRYSDVRADDGELLIYDEETSDGWIQSDLWLDAALLQ